MKLQPTPDEIYAANQIEVERARDESSFILLVEDKDHKNVVNGVVENRSFLCVIVYGRENVDSCIMPFGRQSGLPVHGLIDDDARGWNGIENEDRVFKTDYWDVEASLMMTSLFEPFSKLMLPGVKFSPSALRDELIRSASKIGKYRKAALDEVYGARFQHLDISEYFTLRFTEDEHGFTTFSFDFREDSFVQAISPDRPHPGSKLRFEQQVRKIDKDIRRGKIDERLLSHGKDFLCLLGVCQRETVQVIHRVRDMEVAVSLLNPGLTEELQFLSDINSLEY
jgi:hypothetical protein